MRIYILFLLSLIILIISTLSFFQIGAYDSLLTTHQIDRVNNKQLFLEWVPHSSISYVYIIKILSIFTSEVSKINFIGFTLNNLIASFISYYISHFITSNIKLRLLTFVLTGIYFSNFMAVFYWDHIGFTLGLLLLALYLSKKDYKILVSLIFSFLFFLKIQIFVGLFLSYLILKIIDLKKNKITLFEFLKFKAFFIAVLLMTFLTIMTIYELDVIADYFGYIYGRYSNVDSSIPFSNTEVGSNYSIFKIFKVILYPLNIKLEFLTLNFTIMTFILQIIIYFSYFFLIKKKNGYEVISFLLISQLFFSAYLGRGFMTNMAYFPLILIYVSENLGKRYKLIPGIYSILLFFFLFINELVPIKKFLQEYKVSDDYLISYHKTKIQKQENILIDNIPYEPNSNELFKSVKNDLEFLSNQIYLNNNFFIFGHYTKMLFFLDGRDFINKYPFTYVLNEHIFTKNFSKKDEYIYDIKEQINKSEYAIVNKSEYSKSDINYIESNYLSNFKLIKKKGELSIYSKTIKNE